LGERDPALSQPLCGVTKADVQALQLKLNNSMKKKILRQLIMLSKRLMYGFFIQLFMCSVLLANTGKAQRKTIEEVTLSIDLRDKTLLQFFRHVEAKTDFKFTYNNDLVDLRQKVTVEERDLSLYKVLETVSRQIDLYFVQVNDNIHVKSPTNGKGVTVEMEHVKDVAVSGTVTDANSQPIPGVTVFITGTNIGTATDINGKYSITVPEGSELVFSFVGYETQKIALGGRTIINVTLREDMASLDEVVVVGYGTQKIREVTSSIAHLDESDFPQGAVYQSPLQLLSGRIAGLAVSRANGGDPTAGVEIQLRGVSSIRGSNAPLVVVDGVPGGSLSAIPPESIESISVLRDGSAAAIYGTRANAGVIIITTKQGVPGKQEITYSSYLYTERYANKPSMINSEKYRSLISEWANSDDDYLREAAAPMVDYGHDTDWFDVITQSAISQVHNLSMSGGSEHTRYFGSFNFRDQNGLIKRTGKSEINGKLSLIHTEIDGRLTVNLNLSNTFITAHPFDGNIMEQAYKRNPTMPVYNSDPSLTSYLYNPSGELFEISGYRAPNPIGLIEQFDRDNRSAVFLGSGKVSFEFIPGLIGSVLGAYERLNATNNFYESKDSWSSWNETQAGGSASKTSSLVESKTLESTLNYDFEIGGNHKFSALVGYSFQEQIDENFGAANRTFLSDLFKTNNLGAGLQISRGSFATPVSSSKSSNRLIAGFARVNYNYQEKYLFSASIRREGSTRFGIDNKWGNFPAVSAGWRISGEEFMANSSVITELKLRAGYGVTGNQGIPNYLSLSRLNRSGFMLYQGEWIPGYSPSSNPNPNLRWEKKSEANFGVDVTFFKNVSLTLDLYDRTTKDLLFEYRVPVPPNIFERTWANVGSINNKGIELSVSATAISKEDFIWQPSFNISFNSNKLVSLSNDLYEQSDLRLALPNAGVFGLSDETIYRVEEGKPIGNIYTWEHAGFSEQGEWLVWNADNTEKILPTQANYEDRRVTGNGVPKSWFGFNNTIIYRDFDLQLSLRGALGFELLNMIHLHRARINMLPANIPVRTLDEPALLQSRSLQNYLDSYWVEKGDYVKLDNLALGYTIPVKGVHNLRVYLSGQNLLTITKYKGEDPEHSIVGLIPSHDDYWNYPKTRTYSAGLNLKF